MESAQFCSSIFSHFSFFLSFLFKILNCNLLEKMFLLLLFFSSYISFQHLLISLLFSFYFTMMCFFYPSFLLFHLFLFYVDFILFSFSLFWPLLVYIHIVCLVRPPTWFITSRMKVKMKKLHLYPLSSQDQLKA